MKRNTFVYSALAIMATIAVVIVCLPVISYIVIGFSYEYLHLEPFEYGQLIVGGIPAWIWVCSSLFVLSPFIVAFLSILMTKNDIAKSIGSGLILVGFLLLLLGWVLVPDGKNEYVMAAFQWGVNIAIGLFLSFIWVVCIVSYRLFRKKESQ